MNDATASGCRNARHPDATARPNRARPSLGGGPLGNLKSAITDAEALATIDAAWDLGIRSFDTAPHYGLGLSERRLGEALRTRPRDSYRVSTKVGRVLEPNDHPDETDPEFEVPATHRRRFDFSPTGIRASLESSLERLGLDRIDAVYLHDPDDHLDEAMSSGVETLARLRDEGIVGAIGVGMNHAAPLALFARRTDIDRVMVAGRLTLLDQSATDDLLDACRSHDVDVVAAGVFNSGILAQDTPTAGDHYDYRPATDDVVERAQHLQRICAQHGLRLREAAIGYPQTFPEVIEVCVGAAHPTEIDEAVSALERSIPDAVWHDLVRAGLLAPSALPPEPH